MKGFYQKASITWIVLILTIMCTFCGAYISGVAEEYLSDNENEEIDVFPMGIRCEEYWKEIEEIMGVWKADDSFVPEALGLTYGHQGDLVAFLPECVLSAPGVTSNPEDVKELPCTYDKDHYMAIQGKKLYWEMHDSELWMYSLDDDRSMTFHRYYTDKSQFKEQNYGSENEVFYYVGTHPILSVPEYIYGVGVFKVGIRIEVNKYEADNTYAVFYPKGIKVLSGQVWDLPYLSHIYIPDAVKVIEDYTIYRCPRLRSLSLPTGVEKYPKGFIRESGIEEVIFIKPAYEINNALISCKELKRIVAYDSSIDLIDAFEDCPNLKEVWVRTAYLTIKDKNIQQWENVEIYIVRCGTNVTLDPDVEAELIKETEGYYIARIKESANMNTPEPTEPSEKVETVEPSDQMNTQKQESIASIVTPQSAYKQVEGATIAVVNDVRAKDYVQGNDPYAYAPEKMIDGDENTAWQFSTKTNKLKETYAYFDFAEPITVDELWIKNGFWTVTNGKDQYTRNSRVKELGVAFLYEGESDYTDKLTLKLKDDKKRTDWQKLSLKHHEKVIGIRFRIMSIYKGSKYPTDVCISEVMFIRNE